MYEDSQGTLMSSPSEPDSLPVKRPLNSTPSSSLEPIDSSHNSQKAFRQCQLCPSSFKTLGRLNIHYKSSHSDDSSFQRFLVNLRTQRMSYKASGKPFSCWKCGKSFALPAHLVRHKRMHLPCPPTSETDRYHCHLCDKSYVQAINLRRHLVAHSGLKNFSCRICGKTFAHKYNLDRHLLVHSAIKPHPCPLCAKTFIRPYYLARHLSKHNDSPEPSGSPLELEKCKDSFLIRYPLHNSVSHQRKGSTEQTNVAKHSCSRQNCKKYLQDGNTSDSYEDLDYVDRSNLHLFGDSKDDPQRQKPYACHLCPNSYAQAVNLKRHLVTHTGEKKFSCPVCGMSFYQQYHLTRHAFVHSENKPYPCHFCQKSFTRPYHLNRHLLTHSRDEGKGSCICPFCGRSFLNKGQLREHITQHSGEIQISLVS